MATKNRNTSFVIKTQRLGLRNWTEQDITAMVAISSDPAVMAFFPATATEGQTQRFLKHMQEMYNRKKYCYFAVEELTSGAMIGFIGLCYQIYESDFTPCVDIGWRLKKTAWGKGYATEGAKACLQYAFQGLKLPRVLAVAPEVNKPSIHVMKKIGMRFVKTFEHPRLLDEKRLKNCVLYESIPSFLSRQNRI